MVVISRKFNKSRLLLGLPARRISIDKTALTLVRMIASPLGRRLANAAKIGFTSRLRRENASCALVHQDALADDERVSVSATEKKRTFGHRTARTTHPRYASVRTLPCSIGKQAQQRVQLCSKCPSTLVTIKRC